MILFSGMEGTKLSSPKIIEKRTFTDSRGYFQEVAKEGDDTFVGLGSIKQINMSRSSAGVLRGIHAQKGMDKAMWVANGEAIIYAVLLDRDSNKFGTVVSEHLKAGDGKVFYAPHDWGRGFLAMKDNTVVVYACSDFYRPEAEYGVNPLTCGLPSVNEEIAKHLVISDKDKEAISLKEFKEGNNGSEEA